MGGMAVRVPTPNVSLIDLTAELESDATAEHVNAAFRKAAHGALQGILQYSEELLVSVDLNGNAHSAIFDAPLTVVLDKRLVKVIAWYDNEWGYSCRVRDLLKFMASRG
jgi:glyceraldehyde 3-phosphate dehydrogenase